MNGVSIAAEGRKVGTIQISEAVIDDVPGVSAVLRSVIEHRTVLAVVNQTAVGRWGRHANDVQAVTVLTAGRHTRPQLTYSELAGNGVFAPSTSSGITPRHVERCIYARVADNHLTTARGVHDGRPSDADGLHTFIGDFAPSCAVVEVVTGSAVIEWGQFQAHGPSGRNRICSTGHAVINGRVRLKVVLGIADDLALNYKVAVLDVFDVRVRLALQRLLRTVREVSNRMAWHGRSHTQCWRKLGHIFQQGLASGLEGLCKSSEGDCSHHQENEGKMLHLGWF